MNIGDLVYYDRYGERWETVSPSENYEDYGIGIVLTNVASEWWFDDETNFICVMKEDGIVKEFSTSYIKQLA